MLLPRYKIIDKVLDVPMQNPSYPGFMMGSYQTLIVSSTAQHALIYKPDVASLTDTVPLVRINSACYSGDIFGDRRCDCTEQLFATMNMIESTPGLILYHFNHEGRGLGFTAKLSTYKKMSEEGISTFDAMIDRVGVPDLRRYGSAIVILKDLGIKKIRLATNNPDKKNVLEENGIEVVETVPVVINRPDIQKYLATKITQQGHTINFNDRSEPKVQKKPKKEGLIVLGAKGSLGSAFLEAAADHKKLKKAHVHLLDRLPDPSIFIKPCDLSSSSSINIALEEIDFSQSSHWRVLVATGIYNGKVSDCTDWNEVSASLQVNLIGLSQFVIGAVDKIKKSEKTARIAIVSSAAASVGSRDLGYGIAKAGITGLVRSISKQTARDGITVIGIAPSLFKSNMSETDQSQDRRQDAINQNHLGRSLELKEIVKTAFFAVYKAPDALTGTFLNPNGGQVIGVEPGF